MVSQINGNCIAYHFIGIVYVFVYKFELIRETLYPCNFTYSHPAIKMLTPFYKLLQILFNFYHLRCLWM